MRYLDGRSCGTDALNVVIRSLPTAHHSHKKTINIDSRKMHFPQKKLLGFDRICQNPLLSWSENMKSATLPADKSAIRNPRSEMGGPYLTNCLLSYAYITDQPFVKTPGFHWLIEWLFVNISQQYSRTRFLLSTREGKRIWNGSWSPKNPVTLNRWSTGFRVLCPLEKCMVKDVVINQPCQQRPRGVDIPLYRNGEKKSDGGTHCG